MLRSGDRLLFEAEDLLAHVRCEHLLRLTVAAACGELPCPGDVEDERARTFEDGSAATVADMREGAGLIRDPVLFDGHWLGHALLLERVDLPSDLGPYRYEPVGTVPNGSSEADALLGLCVIGDLLTAILGTPPEHVHLLMPDGTKRPHRLRDYAAYYAGLKRRFLAAIATPTETYPEPVAHCAACTWVSTCDHRRRQDDHVSLVVGIRRDEVRRLRDSSIATVADLAARPAGQRVKGMSGAGYERLRAQAALQLRARQTPEPLYELLPLEGEGRGVSALPEPSPGDLFLHLDGDPGGVEGAVFGVLEAGADGPIHHALVLSEATISRHVLEQLVDLLLARVTAEPQLHVYHYGGQALNALKQLAGREARREAEVDALLRGRVFVDLQRLTRQGLRLSQDVSTARQLVATYCGPLRSDDLLGEPVSAANPSGELVISASRLGCEAVRQVRGWLEERRSEAETAFGAALARPGSPDAVAAPVQTEVALEVETLADALLAGVPERAEDRSPEEAAQWLLAHLLSWHRREAKPAWWTYFDRLGRSDIELVDDAEAIGGLRYEGSVGTAGRSTIHRYRFDPEQDHRLGIGDDVIDPRTGRSAGVLQQIDRARGVLELRRTAPGAEQVRSVMPGGPPSTQPLEAALRRLASWVLANGIDANGPYRAGRDLLLRRPPQVAGVRTGDPLWEGREPLLDCARRLVQGLEQSYLPIQGPPGTGKTFAGARMIVDLVRAGRRIGICANSHRAIVNLLEATCDHAQEEGIELRALQRGPEAEWCRSPLVKGASSNEQVERAIQNGAVDVVAGTPWLFARSGLDAAVDVLFVDEASQLSLANVLAISGSCRNLVLLGDPQQLPQPSQGSHPPGVEVSALGHVVGEAATMLPEAGLLLDTTWRMHPEICAYISEIAYDGRLVADPSCASQSLSDGPVVAGSGLWHLPVVHTGNRATSPEEIERVEVACNALLGRPWTDHQGRIRKLTPEDILVVAPYNAQVARLASRLPEGIRVGTVDRFQGQEGAVVLFSLTTSSAEDLPHAMDFLFSLNRLNVAISRARALAILIYNPSLLHLHCTTPDQMRLVNAFCRFVDQARECQPS